MVLDINSGNRKIAIYDGYTDRGDDYFIHPLTNNIVHISELRYDLSWELLMKVVEDTGHIGISPEHAYILTGDLEWDCDRDTEHYGETLKLSVWLAVIEFIDWYNDND